MKFLHMYIRDKIGNILCSRSIPVFDEDLALGLMEDFKADTAHWYKKPFTISAYFDTVTA